MLLFVFKRSFNHFLKSDSILWPVCVTYLILSLTAFNFLYSIIISLFPFFRKISIQEVSNGLSIMSWCSIVHIEHFSSIRLRFNSRNYFFIQLFKIVVCNNSVTKEKRTDIMPPESKKIFVLLYFWPILYTLCHRNLHLFPLIYPHDSTSDTVLQNEKTYNLLDHVFLQ